MLEARSRLERTLRKRHHAGLDLPYGAAAFAARLVADKDPPGPEPGKGPSAKGTVKTDPGPIPI